MEQKCLDIRTVSKAHCPICGHEGAILYRNLGDRLFGVEGEWNLRKCVRRDCWLIWVDPMPVTDDISKLYQSYYTHQTAVETVSTSEGVIHNLYRKAKFGYLARRYHYQPDGAAGNFDLFLSYIFQLLPNRRADLDYPFWWLSSMPKGYLLEIGCGAGGMLEKMRVWGWSVVGVDLDEKAVAVARDKGFDVRCGDLMKCEFDKESFDAIIMHHVLEHIENPATILGECERILRRDGVLIITTPNSESLGHVGFGKNWRGLEVPRHLMIYSIRSMKKLAGLVGMDYATIFSCGRGGIDVLRQSYGLKRYGVASSRIGLLPRFGLEMMWLFGWFMNLFSPDRRWGEELVFIYHKCDCAGRK